MAKKVAIINLAATGDVVAATAGQTIRVYGVVILNGAATAQTVTIGGDLSGGSHAYRLPSSLGGGVVIGGPSEQEPLFTLATGAAFTLTLTANTQVDGGCWFTKG